MQVKQGFCVVVLISTRNVSNGLLGSTFYINGGRSVEATIIAYQ